MNEFWTQFCTSAAFRGDILLAGMTVLAMLCGTFIWFVALLRGKV